MEDTYICPDCKRRCYIGTPHQCGPNSLAHAPSLPSDIACGAIAELLNGTVWSPQTIEDVAAILREAGYEIAETNGEAE